MTPDQLPALLAKEPLTVIAAHFDPLYAPMAEALEALGQPLLAVVLPREGGYLKTQAGAEMAASLRCVRHVVIGPVALPIDQDWTGREAAWRTELESTVLRKSRG